MPTDFVEFFEGTRVDAEHLNAFSEAINALETRTLIREILSGMPDNVLASFSTSQVIALNTETVFVNGLAQRPAVDYSTSGATVTFVEPPEPGDVLQITYSTGA
jgi:hypothetical protein